MKNIAEQKAKTCKKKSTAKHYTVMVTYTEWAKK